jgi:hypothetical protein
VCMFFVEGGPLCSMHGQDFPRSESRLRHERKFARVEDFFFDL